MRLIADGVNICELTGSLEGGANIFGRFHFGDEFVLLDEFHIDKAAHCRKQERQLIRAVGRILIERAQDERIGERARRVQQAIGHRQTQRQPGLRVFVVGALLPLFAPLEIVYEDEDILILNKPVGILSQKAEKNDYSANEMVIDYLLESGQLTRAELRTFHPSICNRLDRNTSGLLIAGKTIRGLQEMAEALKSRSMQKYYRCLVAGQLTQDAHLKGYLAKNHQNNKVTVHKEAFADASYIETAYHPVKVYENMTLLEVHLITGRSHQIRAHLASIGHPILGDGKYGDKKINQAVKDSCRIRSQLLHAYRMEFPDGRIVTAPEPASFARVQTKLAKEKR